MVQNICFFMLLKGMGIISLDVIPLIYKQIELLRIELLYYNGAISMVK